MFKNWDLNSKLNFKFSSFLLFVLLSSTQALYACGCQAPITKQSYSGKCVSQGGTCKCIIDNNGQNYTCPGNAGCSVQGAGCES